MMKKLSKISYVTSALAHVLVLLFISRPETSEKIATSDESIDFIEAPRIEEQSTYSEKSTDEKPIKKPRVRAVYGVNKSNDSKVSSESSVSVKEGNTLNKQQDNLKLKDGEETLLNPVSAFSVSSLPKKVKEVKANYPSEARVKGVEGDVIVELLIDKQGKVRSARVIKSPSPLLDEPARSALLQYEFSPALKGGEPVAVKIKYTYTFELSGS